MRAKAFRRIKDQMRYYDVWVTSHCDLFGVRADGKPKATLLARSPQEAAKRAYRKGIRHRSSFSNLSSSQMFARYAVRPSNKVSERFTTYWK